MPLRLDDIRAWIEVDGRELPSYFAKVHEKRGRVECYVPSEEGKTFAICWQNLHRSTDTGTRLVVDGVNVKGTRLHPFTRRPGSGERVDMQRQSGVQTSVRTERAFVFARPGTEGFFDQCSASSSDDSHTSSDTETGTITMVVSELSRECTKSRTEELASPPPSLSPVSPSRSDHIIQLGETREITPSTYRQKCHRLRDIATFVFKYRPLEFLREMEHYLSVPAHSSISPHRPVQPPPYEVYSRRRSLRFSIRSRWSDRTESTDHGSSSNEEAHKEPRAKDTSRRRSLLMKKQRPTPSLPVSLQQ
ncbi:hypothetical protein BKA70DRAFT_721459 [Coprinopsis sp. MPI-PUGE-AT-0042]|nr:hypothetical protein BKA70DRAFT_721459 [Coprinopsis sp. MPI-PUGE-AT-0042]